MPKPLTNHLILLTSLTILVGCSRSDHPTKIAVQVGEEETDLGQPDDVSRLREEILRHVRSDWDAHGRTETDWIRAYSLRNGNEADANAALHIEAERSLSFRSECSTVLFRIRTLDTGVVVLEEKRDSGPITETARASSSDWHLLEAIIESTLNDSILKAVLDNGARQW